MADETTGATPGDRRISCIVAIGRAVAIGGLFTALMLFGIGRAKKVRAKQAQVTADAPAARDKTIAQEVVGE